MDTLMLLYLTSKRQKSLWKSEYMKKRKTHGEFALTSEFCDKQFTVYFRTVGFDNLFLHFQRYLATLRGAGESRRRTVLPCPTSQLALTHSNAWITETCAALPCVGCVAKLCPEHCVAQAKADAELCSPALPLNSRWHIQTRESQTPALLCPTWAALPASQSAPYLSVSTLQRDVKMPQK
jgi:hypothetical protein